MVVIKIVEIFTNNQLYGGRGLEYNHERPCFVSPGVLLPLSSLSSLLCNPWLHLARPGPVPSPLQMPTHEEFSLRPDEFLIHHCFYLALPKGAEAEKWYLAQQTGIKHWELRPRLLRYKFAINVVIDNDINSVFTHYTRNSICFINIKYFCKIRYPKFVTD